jgi:hypothetical protein
MWGEIPRAAGITGGLNEPTPGDTGPPGVVEDVWSCAAHANLNLWEKDPNGGPSLYSGLVE